MTGKTSAQNWKAFSEDWWTVCITFHVKNRFCFQRPCPLNKHTKIFLPPNTERFFSWLVNEVLADMSKTEISRSGLAVSIWFKRSTCVWTARYLMESNHVGDWITGERCYHAFWELLHVSWRNPCSLPNDVIFLRRKEDNVSYAELELVFISISAAACFVFVCKLCCFFPSRQLWRWWPESCIHKVH